MSQCPDYQYLFREIHTYKEIPSISIYDSITTVTEYVDTITTMTEKKVNVTVSFTHRSLSFINNMDGIDFLNFKGKCVSIHAPFKCPSNISFLPFILQLTLTVLITTYLIPFILSNFLWAYLILIFFPNRLFQSVIRYITILILSLIHRLICLMLLLTVFSISC